MKAIHAIASNANPVSRLLNTCSGCGAAIERCAPCPDPDCPSHDDPVSDLEAFQWAAEDNLHRAKGRYVRPVRVPKVRAAVRH